MRDPPAVLVLVLVAPDHRLLVVLEKRHPFAIEATVRVGAGDVLVLLTYCRHVHVWTYGLRARACARVNEGAIVRATVADSPGCKWVRPSAGAVNPLPAGTDGKDIL